MTAPAPPTPLPANCPLCDAEMILARPDGWARHPLNGCFLERRALHGPDNRAAWNRRAPPDAAARIGVNTKVGGPDQSGLSYSVAHLRGDWCQPGDDQATRRWLLTFDDPDRSWSVFDNEADARANYAKANTAWSCYLFAAAPLHPAPPDAAMAEALDGNRSLPWGREELGRFVREAWVRWAQTQPDPKPSWLVPYADLSEVDKEADRQIGEAVARWTLIGDAARAALAAGAGGAG